MTERLVPVPIAMRLPRVNGLVVNMVVVFVMVMAMLVQQLVVDVFVLIAQVQPDAESHQGSRCD